MRPTTFSIVAYDASSGEVGIAVASKFLSVGAVVPFVRAGAGAIATQAFANTSFGPRALDLLAAGAAPAEVAATLAADDEGREDRQFGIVAARENVAGATFTGTRCIEWAGGVCGPGFAAQGNCLASPAVVDALAATFASAGAASTGTASTAATLADRLVAALRAGEAAGGDKRGRQSAALVIEKPKGGYAGFNDRYVDLRADDHADPVAELARLLDLHKLYFFPPDPADVLPIGDVLGAEIVRELQRVGALDRSHAAFDDRAHAKLVAFMHVENLENRVRHDGAIDRATLDYLRAAPSR